MNQKQQYHCGAWWTPKIIRKILSLRFNASCKIHDLDYATTLFDREKADTRFLLHMIRQSKSNILHETTATLYYISVRILGKLSWGNNSKK